jgi:sec-independent protein translocase protein TatA
MTALAFLGPIGLPEMLVILVVGLLIFGARLPEVGRSMGRGLMEFKKGLRGVQDEFDTIDRESDRLVDAEVEKRRSLPETPPPVREGEVTPDPFTLAVKEMQGDGDPQPDGEPVSSPRPEQGDHPSGTHPKT